MGVYVGAISASSARAGRVSTTTTHRDFTVRRRGVVDVERERTTVERDDAILRGGDEIAQRVRVDLHGAGETRHDARRDAARRGMGINE